MRSNYYLILELPVDPLVLDVAGIERRIEEKRTFWNKNRNHPTNGARYKMYGELVEDMRERLLRNPASLKKEAEEAKALLLKNLDRAISDFSADGEITPIELDYLLKEFPQFREETIRGRFQVPFVETPSETTLPPPEKPPIDPSIKLPDTMTMNLIELNLELVGKEDLYAFLARQRTNSCERLIERANEMEEQNRKHAKKTAEVDAIGVLSGLARKVFADESSKKGYDAKLRLRKFETELIPVMIRRSLNERRTPDKKQMLGRVVALHDYEKSIEEARELGLNEQEAEWYVHDFLVTKRKCFDPRPAKGDSRRSSVKIQCFSCFRLNDPDLKHCSSCGLPLSISCPKCNRSVRSESSKCGHCGFAIGDMPIALIALEKARKAILDGDLESGISFAEQALLFWPGNGDAVAIKSDAEMQIERKTAKQREIDQLESDILDAIRYREFYRAESELIRLKSRNPNHSLFASKEPEVRNTIRETERKLLEAERINEPTARKKAFEDIRVFCADCRIANEELRRILPNPPGKVKIRTVAQGLEVSWETSPSSGKIEYRIVRKEGTPPSNPKDGEMVCGSTERLSFIDSSPEPNVPYAYTVFARFAGLDFEKTGSQSGLGLLEPVLRNISVIPGSSRLEVRWTPIRNVVRFKVGRYKTSDPLRRVAISNISASGFLDAALENDVEYEYTVNIGYKTLEGREKFTPDFVIKGTPLAPPDSVKDLNIVYAEGAIGFKWTPPRKGEFFLFVSDKPFKETPGKVYSREFSEMSASYGVPIPIADQARGTTLWKTAFKGKRFILPVTFFGNVMTVGIPRELVIVPEVLKIDSRSLNRQLYLNWEWPEGIKKVLVAIRTDKYPEGPSDSAAAKKILTIEEYKLDGACVLQQQLQRNLYITVYSMLEENGTPFFSGGVRHQTLKTVITYRIDIRKASLFRSVQAKLVVEVLSGFGKMPSFTLMKNQARPPLNRSDGHVIKIISARLGREQEIELDPSVLSSNSYARLFLEKESDQELFSIVDPWDEERQLWR